MHVRTRPERAFALLSYQLLDHVIIMIMVYVHCTEWTRQSVGLADAAAGLITVSRKVYSNPRALHIQLPIKLPLMAYAGNKGTGNGN
jgi:hypothetical protein